ncbi:MAG TPA: DUF853 family protein [Bacteroidia bacterium]|nr:DUF853 family protein [Bacteroidia bacterium]HNT80327.1 DUF853 family protein [Bacteroidia bacterium]
MSSEAFKEQIENGYSFKGDFIILGGAMHELKCLPGLHVKAALKTFNRHGLISGATGTGKTKTIQRLAEALSEKGVPTLLMDVKGDLSGLAAASEGHSKIDERHEQIGKEWKASAYPVELLSISNEKGVRLRATVSEFGPVLFSKILELNDTQQGVVALVFKYADDHQLPLLDLKDFKKTLQYLTNEAKEEIEKEYGRISTASTATIIRKIIELEEQGAELFFGEESFDTEDLMRIDEQGRGYMNIMRITDIQDKPRLFSTFMLSLLAEIYNTFPEEGDTDAPKLVLFVDEAHLVFKEASKALMDQIETIIKLIRSKGVGVFFCTQNPSDVPSAVLSQLGLKVQHALRAFTAADRKNIKQVADNYPLSDFYETDELLTQLGIGEALITGLNEKGIPTPLAHTMLCAPQSRMDILNEKEIDELVKRSTLVKKYNQSIDRESAYELLNAKLKSIQEEEEEENTDPESKKGKEETVIGKAVDSTVGRQVMRTVARELTRGLLGVLGIKSSTRRRSRKSIF